MQNPAKQQFKAAWRFVRMNPYSRSGLADSSLSEIQKVAACIFNSAGDVLSKKSQDGYINDKKAEIAMMSFYC